MSDKKPITVTAEHQAYGVVEFTLLAKDAKGAFDTWKQLVAYPR